MNAENYYIGDPLRGTFRVSVAAIAGEYRPNFTAINLRLIGKRSLTDPDEKALFDSARTVNPHCTVEIESNDGEIITGIYSIAGEATAPLKSYKPAAERPGLDLQGPTIPVYYAFTALYAGATRRKVLGTGVIPLKRDRVEDPR